MKRINLLSFFVLLVFSAAAQVPNYVPTDSLQAWYPFNGNANNAYGTGKNGVVLGGCTLTSDRFGNPNAAYHFNGDSSHILIDTPFFNVGWHNYTISVWMNCDTLNDPYVSNQSQMVVNTVPHNGIGLNLNWGNSDHYRFYLNSNPGVVSWDLLPGDSSTAVLDTVVHTWRHMVFTKDNDSTYSFYLDGALDRTFHSTINAVSYYCKIMLGHIDTIHSPETFWGALDDYGFWNRTLAPCEARRLFHSSPYTYITVQPVNVTAGIGTTTHFRETDTGTGNTYQWQVSTGGAFTNLSSTAPYSGVTTPTLTITGVTASLNNNKYRCIVSGNQVCVDTSAAGELTTVVTGIAPVTVREITIAPNPTTGEIFVSGAGLVNIKVYNAVGQLVKEADQAERISIAGLPSGLYVVKLFDEDHVLVGYGKTLKQ